MATRCAWTTPIAEVTRNDSVNPLSLNSSIALTHRGMPNWCLCLCKLWQILTKFYFLFDKTQRIGEKRGPGRLYSICTCRISWNFIVCLESIVVFSLEKGLMPKTSINIYSSTHRVTSIETRSFKKVKLFLKSARVLHNNGYLLLDSQLEFVLRSVMPTLGRIIREKFTDRYTPSTFAHQRDQYTSRLFSGKTFALNQHT